jgi:hypothetical protein
VIARAIALTIPCLPHSHADGKRVGLLVRPDRGARFADARDQDGGLLSGACIAN